jgi:hypothetical protein
MRAGDCSFARLVLFPLFPGISFPISQYDSGLRNNNPFSVFIISLRAIQLTIPRPEDLGDLVQLRRQVQSMFNIPGLKEDHS